MSPRRRDRQLIGLGEGFDHLLYEKRHWRICVTHAQIVVYLYNQNWVVHQVLNSVEENLMYKAIWFKGKGEMKGHILASYGYKMVVFSPEIDTNDLPQWSISYEWKTNDSKVDFHVGWYEESDTNKVITAGARISIWDIVPLDRKCRLWRTYDTGFLLKCFSLPKDGSFLATAGNNDRLIHVWHLTSSSPSNLQYSLLPHPHALESIQCSLDLLIALDQAGELSIWQATRVSEDRVIFSLIKRFRELEYIQTGFITIYDESWMDLIDSWNNQEATPEDDECIQTSSTSLLTERERIQQAFNKFTTEKDEIYRDTAQRLGFRRGLIADTHAGEPVIASPLVLSRQPLYRLIFGVSSDHQLIIWRIESLKGLRVMPAVSLLSETSLERSGRIAIADAFGDFTSSFIISCFFQTDEIPSLEAHHYEFSRVRRPSGELRVGEFQLNSRSITEFNASPHSVPIRIVQLVDKDGLVVLDQSGYLSIWTNEMDLLHVVPPRDEVIVHVVALRLESMFAVTSNGNLVVLEWKNDTFVAIEGGLGLDHSSLLVMNVKTVVGIAIEANCVLKTWTLEENGVSYSSKVIREGSCRLCKVSESHLLILSSHSVYLYSMSDESSVDVLNDETCALTDLSMNIETNCVAIAAESKIYVVYDLVRHKTKCLSVLFHKIETIEWVRADVMALCTSDSIGIVSIHGELLESFRFPLPIHHVKVLDPHHLVLCQDTLIRQIELDSSVTVLKAKDSRDDLSFLLCQGYFDTVAHILKQDIASALTQLVHKGHQEAIEKRYRSFGGTAGAVENKAEFLFNPSYAQPKRPVFTLDGHTSTYSSVFCQVYNDSPVDSKELDIPAFWFWIGLQLKTLNWHHTAWALVSKTQSVLWAKCKPEIKRWKDVVDLFVPVWLHDKAELKQIVEAVAREEYLQSNRDPAKCALFYILAGKKQLLAGLYRVSKQSRVAELLLNDFSETRWKNAAIKNAHVLKSKQQYELSAAFFLLGDLIPQAIASAALADQSLMLAILICRLKTNDMTVIGDRMLRASTEKEWMAFCIHWMLEQPQKALTSVLSSSEWGTRCFVDYLKLANEKQMISLQKRVLDDLLTRENLVEAYLTMCECQYPTDSDERVKRHVLQYILTSMAAQLRNECIEQSVTIDFGSQTASLMQALELPDRIAIGQYLWSGPDRFSAAIVEDRFLKQLMQSISAQLFTSESNYEDLVYNTKHLILWLLYSLQREDLENSLIRQATATVYTGLCLVVNQKRHKPCCVFRMLCQVFPHAYGLKARTIDSNVPACSVCQDLKYKPSVSHSLERDVRSLYDSITLTPGKPKDEEQQSCQCYELFLLLLNGSMSWHMKRLMKADSELEKGWRFYFEFQIPQLDQCLETLVRDNPLENDCCEWTLISEMFDFQTTMTELRQTFAQYSLAREESIQWGFTTDSLRVLSPRRVTVATTRVFEQTEQIEPIRSICLVDDNDLLFCTSKGIYNTSDSTTSSFHEMSKVTAIESHPTMREYFLTGTSRGELQLWNQHSNLFESSVEVNPVAGAGISRIRFDPLGQQFGACDVSGLVQLWRFNTKGINTSYAHLECHNRGTCDFTFLNSSSCLATVGSSTKNRNLSLWDTLLPPEKALICSPECHSAGALSLVFSDRHQMLISGGEQGSLCIFDLRDRRLLHTIKGAHETGITTLSVHPNQKCFLSGTQTGRIKIWSLPTFRELADLPQLHGKSSFLTDAAASVISLSPFGITDSIATAQGFYTSGSDGAIQFLKSPATNFEF